MNTARIDMTGKRYGCITAVRPNGLCKSRDIKWLFKCDCGVEFSASGYAARNGKIATCPECAAKRIASGSIKHGMSSTPEFGIWTDIKTRCYNQNHIAFKHYGGRGIAVCERWLSSFENFLADIGKRPSRIHSIDRIDTNGNYEPENCRWATGIEQANNRRNNIRIVIDGTEKTLTEWCRDLGVSYSSAWLRYQQGCRGNDLFVSRRTTLTHVGITDSISGWSRRTGIKQSTIYMRLTKYGWTVADALTKGSSL